MAQDKVIIYKGRKQDKDKGLYVGYKGNDLKEALNKFNVEEKYLFDMYVEEGFLSSYAILDTFNKFEELTEYINSHDNQYFLDNINEVKEKLHLMLKVLYVEAELKEIEL